MPSGRWTDSNRLSRLPPNWKRVVRPAVFAAYGTTCHWCRRPGADSVDHLRPGDDHSLENLRPIHQHPCHAQKSAQEGVEARTTRRESIKRPKERHPGLR